MLEFHSNFGTLAFIPHGHCYLWKPGLVWLHGLSDGLIALAYFSIPIALIYFVRQRRDLPYPWIFQLFGAFIVACGLTHVMEVWTLWHPTYWVSGGLKSVTAIISLTTAAALIPVIPQALTLPSRSELEAAKAELEQQVRDRTQALRLSEERLRLALAGSGDGLWDWNIATGEVYFSPPWQAMLGYGAGELPGQVGTWEALIHPVDQPQALELLDRHLQDPQIPYRFEYRLQTKAGEWKWIATNGKVVAANDQGQPMRMAGTHRDISDRKQAEIALQASERNYRQLINHLNAGFVVHAPNTQILQCNQTACDLLGLSMDQMLGKAAIDPAWHFVREDGTVLPVEEYPVNQVLSTQVPLKNYVGGISHGFEPQVWVLVTAFPEFDSNHQILQIVVTFIDITAQQAALRDRKQAEAALKTSEERLRLALTAAKQGLYDLNLKTGEAIVSPEYIQMLDYDLEGFQETNANWSDRLHPDERATVFQVYEDYITGKRDDYRVEFRQRTKTGLWKWILSVGKIVGWDEQGNPARMIGTHTDISELKQAEADRLQAEQLRLNLTLLATILDIILAGYWDWDIPNHQEYMSPGLKRMFGYADHELPNAPETWQNLIFAADLPGVFECFDRHVQSHGEIPYYNEVRYRHKDGSTIWVICVGQVIEWDAADQPLRMVGCHIDITKLKQTEAQLQKSDAHLRLAQRIGKLGSWELDLHTKQIIWSNETFHIFGRDPAAGTPSFEELQQLFHPDDRDLHQQTVQTAIETAQPYELECRTYHPNGTLVYLLAKGQPILDAVGRVTQLAGTVLDITDRKQAEAKILQTTAQLEASNRELEAFAYSVSHDLRSPLRAIDGFSKALLEDYGDRFDDTGKDYFDRIRRNVHRMGTLIDDLLSLARVSRSEMRSTTVNLSTLVQEQVNELQAVEPTRQVEVVITPAAIVSADLTLMHVVISNLLQNAWKFTRHHPTARIEFGIIKQDGQPVYFVCDDGAGFDMAHSSMLFGVFQRLHNTTEFPGTGIGLAAVQRAIHRHGGQVWAKAAVEQGATIYFTVPNSSIRAKP